MDDTFIHSTAEEHMDDLMDLFKVLRKYGLKLSPHRCQFFKKRIVYMVVHRLLIPICNLQKKAKKFKWTDEAKKAFNEIKKLLISLLVLF